MLTYILLFCERIIKVMIEVPAYSFYFLHLKGGKATFIKL